MSDLPIPHRPSIPDRGLVAASAVAFAGFVSILLMVILNGGADTFDSVVTAGAQPARGSTATLLAKIVTTLGSFPTLVTVAVLAVLSLWFQTRQLWSSAILASAVAATASLVVLVRIAVGRPRPDAATLVGNPATDFSFPSGQTTMATLVYVLAVVLLTTRVRHVRWRRAANALAIALALLIGLSRIYLGYQWATDVLAGWLLAAGVTTTSLFSIRRLGLPISVGSAGSSHTGKAHRLRPTQFVR